jgi:hypothetical protein
MQQPQVGRLMIQANSRKPLNHQRYSWHHYRLMVAVLTGALILATC